MDLLLIEQSAKSDQKQQSIRLNEFLLKNIKKKKLRGHYCKLLYVLLNIICSVCINNIKSKYVLFKYFFFFFKVNLSSKKAEMTKEAEAAAVRTVDYVEKLMGRLIAAL